MTLEHPDEALPLGDTVDVRRGPDFRVGHFAAAISCPLEEIEEQLHLLPDRGEKLWVFGGESELETALDYLAERGYARAAAHPATSAFASPREMVGAAWVGGGERVRLWRPSGFLARIWEELGPELAATAARDGRRPVALDLACGSGRDAAWLALAGMRVVGYDLLPDALALARGRAARSAAALLNARRATAVPFEPPHGVRADLEAGLPARPASADLALCVRFLHRPLFAHAARALTPGGSLVASTFTRRQLAFGKPTNPAHLLEEGEIVRLADEAGLTVRAFEESVPPGGPALAGVWAVRPAS